MEYIMSKCKYCGIEIVDDAVKCPLCSGILDGSKAEGHTYPDVVSNVRKISFLYRLFCFICTCKRVVIVFFLYFLVVFVFFFSFFFFF
mgnify:CR=1 FL=1